MRINPTLILFETENKQTILHTLLRVDAGAERVLLEESAVLSGDDDRPRSRSRRLDLEGLVPTLGLRYFVVL